MFVESGGIIDEEMREGFWRQIWHANLNEGDLNTLTTCLIRYCLLSNCKASYYVY